MHRPLTPRNGASFKSHGSGSCAAVGCRSARMQAWGCGGCWPPAAQPPRMRWPTLHDTKRASSPAHDGGACAASTDMPALPAAAATVPAAAGAAPPGPVDAAPSGGASASFAGSHSLMRLPAGGSPSAPAAAASAGGAAAPLPLAEPEADDDGAAAEPAARPAPPAPARAAPAPAVPGSWCLEPSTSLSRSYSSARCARRSDSANRARKWGGAGQE
jgi:hypothetical protein